jgi:uncharacterized lipoprotein
MRQFALILSAAAVTTLAACQKTGEGEFQVKTPDVDVNVSTDTTTVRTPSVDVKTEPETTIVNVPKVDVETPAERKGEAKRP